MPHQPHSICIKPEEMTDFGENPTIWRYMDFAQLMSLVKYEKLYFSRSDEFDDPYEGTLPKEQRKSRKKSEHIPKEWREELLPKFRKICTKNTFLSCWHMNDSESAAMWDLYLDADHGVCIQSSYQGLKNSLERDKRNIHISAVNYIDYEIERLIGWEEDQPLGSSISPFFHKRKHFKHENELRAIIHDPSWRNRNNESLVTAESIQNTSLKEDSLPDSGMKVEVDTDTLIDKIHVSPEAGDWVAGLLKDFLPEQGIEKKLVRDSRMNEEPGY